MRSADPDADRSRRGLGEPTTSSVLARTVGSLAVAAYLAVGVVPYLVSGLVVPAAALVGLLCCWSLGLIAVLLLVRRRPLLAPLAVVGALLFWLAYVSIGGALLGWTA